MARGRPTDILAPRVLLPTAAEHEEAIAALERERLTEHVQARLIESVEEGERELARSLRWVAAGTLAGGTLLGLGIVLHAIPINLLGSLVAGTVAAEVCCEHAYMRECVRSARAAGAAGPSPRLGDLPVTIVAFAALVGHLLVGLAIASWARQL